MKNIKIAVLDTGIDTEDKDIKDRYVYDKELQVDGIDNIDDVIGHGTLCAKTILERCPEAIIYPIKIFNDEGVTEVSKLIVALANLIGKNIDIINISASMIKENRLEDLRTVCNILRSEGKILVASKHKKAKNIKSYPASFDSVIGVKGYKRICKDDDYTYDTKRENQMYANGRDRLYKFKDSVTAFGKHSRSSALAAGIIAEIMYKENTKDIYKIEQILKSKSNISETYKERRYKYKKEYVYDTIVRKIVDILNENFADGRINIEFLEKNSLINNMTGLYGDNAYDFVCMLNKEFGIDINYENLYLYEIENLYILSHIVHKELDK